MDTRTTPPKTDRIPVAAVVPEPIGHQAARGFAWMLSQSIVTKLVSSVGQVFIAWFLLKEDFGLAAITYLFATIPFLIQQGGLKEVLIQRQRRFHLWCNPAFWMSMTLGLAGGAILAGIAPWAGRLYDEPRVTGLLLVVAVLFPLDAISVVPLARLQTQLRFRFLANLAMGRALAETVLSITFAALGFGAYSLLLPRPILAVAAGLICWVAAPVPLRSSPQLRRWRFLLGDSSRVIVASFCDLAILYGGYLVLSLTRPTEAVGLYFFAFNLSMQATALIVQNLGSVLFPALSTLQGVPRRQTAAFLRAVRLLACLAFPACLLQAACADPGMHLLFPRRYDDAIPIVQVLSIAMAFSAIGRPSIALFQAQGRFHARLGVGIGSVIVFYALIVPAGLWAQEWGVAIAAAIHLIIMEPLHLLFALRPAGFRAVDLLRTISTPAMLGIVVITPAWLIAKATPPVIGLHLTPLLVTLLITAILLPLGLRFLAHDAWIDGKARAQGLLRRRAVTP